MARGRRPTAPAPASVRGEPRLPSSYRPDSARCFSPFANWVNDGPRSGIERQIIGSIGPVYVELVAGLAYRDRRTWITGRVRGTARRPNLRTHVVRAGGGLGPGHGLGAAQGRMERGLTLFRCRKLSVGVRSLDKMI